MAVLSGRTTTLLCLASVAFPCIRGSVLYLNCVNHVSRLQAHLGTAAFVQSAVRLAEDRSSAVIAASLLSDIAASPLLLTAASWWHLPSTCCRGATRKQF